MWCPKCYGGMNKNEGFCTHCGFRFKDLEGATNEQAKIAKREGKKDDIIYTSILPSDVTKKKLLLYCIFLGLFGAHNYYVGKLGKAIYMTTTLVLFALFQTLYSLGVGATFVNYFYSTVSVLWALTIALWLMDLISICINRYKVPVYKEEFSKKD